MRGVSRIRTYVRRYLTSPVNIGIEQITTDRHGKQIRTYVPGAVSSGQWLEPSTSETRNVQATVTGGVTELQVKKILLPHDTTITTDSAIRDADNLIWSVSSVADEAYYLATVALVYRRRYKPGE